MSYEQSMRSSMRDGHMILRPRIHRCAPWPLPLSLGACLGLRWGFLHRTYNTAIPIGFLAALCTFYVMAPWMLLLAGGWGVWDMWLCRF